MSLMSLTAVALGKKVQAGEVTVEEAVLDALEQIEKKEDTIHSYVTVLEKETILEKAKEIQKKIDAGELTGPLAGVPVAIKDNMCTEGVLTTCSSKILYNFVPTYTSEAVKNLEAAGAGGKEGPGTGAATAAGAVGSSGAGGRSPAGEGQSHCPCGQVKVFPPSGSCDA